MVTSGAGGLVIGGGIGSAAGPFGTFGGGVIGVIAGVAAGYYAVNVK